MNNDNKNGGKTNNTNQTKKKQNERNKPRIIKTKKNGNTEK